MVKVIAVRKDSFFNSKYLEDRADGTLVFIILSMPLLLIMLSTIVNVAISVNDKRDIDSLFQQAAQHGVSSLDPYGNINAAGFERAALQVTKELSGSNMGTIYFADGAKTAVTETSSKLCTKPIETGTFTTAPAKYMFTIGNDVDRAYGLASGAAEEERKQVNNRRAVRIYDSYSDAKIKTLIRKAYPTLIRNGGAAVEDSTKAGAVGTTKRSKVIYIDGYVNVRNPLFYPLGEDAACRTHHIQVSAITYGSEGDIDYDKDFDTKMW